MIYQVDDGFVISSKHSWLPGVYESERAARYAFQFPDCILSDLQEEAAPGIVTSEMLREARKKMKNGTIRRQKSA